MKSHGSHRRRSRRGNGISLSLLSLVCIIRHPADAFGPISFQYQKLHYRTPVKSLSPYYINHVVQGGSYQTSLAAITLPGKDDETTAHLPTPILLGGTNDEQIPKTLSQAMFTFIAGPYAGPRITVAIVLSALLYRIRSLPMTMLDPVLFMGAIVFWWFQEHAMHKHLLHSRFDWYAKRIHEVHHQKNYFHISLDPAWLMVTWLTTVFVMLKCVLPLPWALTTAIGYAAAGLFYEWSHFIVHTRVRFAKGSYWKRMKDHHIRHHLVNADNWLGFSLPQVDDLFGTNPDVKEFRKQSAAER